MLFDSTPKWYLMWKPELWQQASMHRAEWACPRRGLELLHCTVIKLGRLAELGCSIKMLIELLALVEADPFVLTLDYARGDKGGTSKLACSKIPAAARKFRSKLLAVLLENGVNATVSKKFDPHVTQHYNWRKESFNVPIAPISWSINEFVLIESLTGKTEHVEHGRFAITPRQGMLFPLTRCSAAPRDFVGETLVPACR